MAIASDPRGSTGASVVLWVAAGLVVMLGMARLPLVPDRAWRFLCWSVAVVLGFYAAARTRLIPSGWIWITWAVLVIVVLALLFWVERLRDLEHRGTDTAKASEVRAIAGTTSPAAIHPITVPLQSTSRPIFDEAPPELASMSQASLAEFFAGRTQAQGDKLMQQHRGKPVRVSGQVEQVSLGSSGKLPSVTLKGALHLLLFFDPEEDYDPEPIVLALHEGDSIVVEGRIWQIADNSVSVDRCRLIESRGHLS